MRTITDSVALTYLLLRASKGAVAQRVSDSVLFALFVLGVLFRGSARSNNTN